MATAVAGETCFAGEFNGTRMTIPHEPIDVCVAHNDALCGHGAACKRRGTRKLCARCKRRIAA
jgi:hypothetical protein